MMKKILLTIFTLVFLCSCLSIETASAVEQQGESESITMSPVKSKFSIDAGETISGKLTVVNDGKTPYDFVVYSRPYSVKDEKYVPVFTDTPKNADAYSWIQFSETQFSAAPGQTVEVPYTINVPDQASPGGHYGALFAETQPTAAQTEANSVFRKKRVGSLLYVTVNGDFEMSGNVTSTSVSFWQLQPPLHAESTVKNTGNSDFVNDTKFVVKDVFGNTKYTEINQYTVLPQTSRKINFDWQGASWLGFYKTEVRQKVLSKTSVKSGYVLILPRYLLVLAIVFVLIGGYYAWSQRKTSRSRRQ